MIYSQKNILDLISKSKIKYFKKKAVAIYKKEKIPSKLFWKVDNTKYKPEFIEKCDYVVVQEVDGKPDVYPIENEKLEKTYQLKNWWKLEEKYKSEYGKKPDFIWEKPWIVKIVKVSDILGERKWVLQTWWWTQNFDENDYFVVWDDEVYVVQAEKNWNPIMYEEVL